MTMLTYLKTSLKICSVSILFVTQSFANPPSKFKGTFDQLIQTAKTQNKKVVFVFSAPWCTSCTKMEKNVEVVFTKTPKFEVDYLWYEVDVTTHEGKAIAHKFQVFEIPTCVITQPDMRPITSWNLGKGYRFMQSSLAELAEW